MSRLVISLVTLSFGVVAAGITSLDATATAAPAENVLTTGQVVSDVDGVVSPVRDAVVTVSWIPDRRLAKPGDELRVVVVATATTDAGGNYTVKLVPTSKMRTEAATNGGWVNFDVSTISPSLARTEFSSVSRRLVANTWLPDQDAALPAPAARAATARTSAAAGGDEQPYVNPATAPVTDVLLDETSPAAAPAAVATAKAMRTSGTATIAAAAAAARAPTYSTPRRSVRSVSSSSTTPPTATPSGPMGRRPTPASTAASAPVAAPGQWAQATRSPTPTRQSQV